MIGTVNEGFIKRCAESVSLDVRQAKRLLEDEAYGFREAAKEWARK
jgi:predicted DsbA family dithiol-disulfide isomerase